jgi:phospholipase/lecithinase/hemolysin
VKKKILATMLAFLTLIAIVLVNQMTSSDQLDRLTELVVFGDSLSDVGNVFRATGGLYPPNPPYFQGRYSNGRVWVEHLAAKLNLSRDRITNAACGGATTGSGSINGVPGLLAQVQSFTNQQKQPNPNTLYVLWAGANDYLYGAATPDIPVSNLSRAITTLIDVGAKAVLVANLPDLGNLPATRNNANANTLNTLTQAHNLGLEKSLAELRQRLDTGIQLIQFDANSLYRAAIENPKQFGFANVKSSCINSTTNCEDPNQFLFWDGIHPTTAAHQILGERAFSTITSRLSSKASS